MKLINKVITEVNVNEPCQSAYEASCLRACALQTIRQWIDIDGLYQFAKNHDVLVDGSAGDFALEFYAAYNNEVQYTY